MWVFNFFAVHLIGGDGQSLGEAAWQNRYHCWDGGRELAALSCRDTGSHLQAQDHGLPSLSAPALQQDAGMVYSGQESSVSVKFLVWKAALICCVAWKGLLLSPESDCFKTILQSARCAPLSSGNSR